MPKKLSLQEINARLIVLGFSSINEQVLTNEKCELICPRCDKKFMTHLHRIFSKHTQSCGCVKGIRKRKGTNHVPMTYLVVYSNMLKLEICYST